MIRHATRIATWKGTIMARVVRLIVQLPPLLLALIFGAQGILWLVRPASAVRFLGYDLPEGGLALSSMIGATAGWALTISACLLLALIRKERFWYYPPMMILGFLALGRIVAGVALGAPHLPERFIPELIFVGLLFLAARNTDAPRAA
ncbi:hypothetical protein [Sphingomonas sp.]|uniref:hypothetical protein n=1 Tax=Sphingomonas sp. TaxID=28214 RepID=UPI001796A8E3|nr:hypothetical protein [Sphingomonas sp.]MBA4761008.1 hypothetical protein [Sphingomonas sp.]